MILAGGDETEEPGLVEAWFGGVPGAGLVPAERSKNGGQKDGDRLLRRGESKGGVYCITPELVAHSTGGGGGGYIGNAGEFEIEGADSEVGGAERWREKGGKDVGRVIILPPY